MILTAVSRNGMAIRLTDERWAHITEEHSELAGMRLEILETVSGPDRVMAARHGALLAVREVEPGKHIVVVYREFEADGFVITAFLTRRTAYLDGREQLWP
ncbi:MAG: hypothetical protein NTU88_17025 [Armatimonadetes bacterium]|nr:hypothetical protein [Armatimonadota bacterium]